MIPSHPSIIRDSLVVPKVVEQVPIRRREPFTIADRAVLPGTRAKLEIPIANLMSGTPVSLPILVVHGVHPGPALWLTAAIHGDELCGIEIIRRVLNSLDSATMSGTVVAVPVVNVHGFNVGDRYLPDRRDLNRSFPGSTRGSLASRLAKLLMSEVIARCEVGIDLHTGSDRRENFPQIRADLDDPRTAHLASVFGAPIAIHSRVRDGSLRQAATEEDSTVLLYEAGEAGRFSETAIRTGTVGTLRVLYDLGMRPEPCDPAPHVVMSRSTSWMRASRSGIVHFDVDLGDHVGKGDIVATIHDPFGMRTGAMKSRMNGMVIGASRSPLVNRGDAVLHIAEIASP